MAEQEPFVVLRFKAAGEGNTSGSDELEIANRKWVHLKDSSGDFECLWPPNVTNPIKLKAFVTKHVEPDETWVSHPCEILSAYRNYLDAHLGLKKRLEDESYETEKELGIGHRKRRIRQISSDEEEERSPAPKKKLPLPPPIVSSSGNKDSFKMHISRKSPIKVQSKGGSARSQAEKSKKGILKIVRHDKGSKAASLHEFKEIIEEKKKESQEKRKAAEAVQQRAKVQVMATSPGWKATTSNNQASPVTDLDSTFELDDPDFHDDLVGDKCTSSFSLRRTETYLEDVYPASKDGGAIHVSTSPQTSGIKKNLFGCVRRTSTSSKGSPSRSDGFERKVLLLLHEINQKVEIISANQTRLNLALVPSEKVLSKPEGMPTVPIKSHADLRKMEKALESSNFVSYLSTYLSTFVLKDPSKEEASAKRVMAALLANSVAKDYSLRGQKGKMKFDELLIWAAVKGAILLKLETDLQRTEKAVQKWLADAAWRKQSDGTASRQKKEKQDSRETISS